LKSWNVKKPVINLAGFFYIFFFMNHNQKGCFAECHFAAIAIQHGYNVSTPLIGSSYYDCILEKDGIMFKIQIKYLGKDRRRHKNSIQITLRRTGLPSYEKKFVDFFALWDEGNNGFFIIPNLGQSCLKININGKYKENFNNFALIS
jgi:hypothetical protein